MGSALSATIVITRAKPRSAANALRPFVLDMADIGFGGDPIVEAAIRIDYPKPYAQTGMYSVQLGGDATRLH
jgi:hypothetical protein